MVHAVEDRCNLQCQFRCAAYCAKAVASPQCAFLLEVYIGLGASFLSNGSSGCMYKLHIKRSSEPQRRWEACGAMRFTGVEISQAMQAFCPPQLSQPLLPYHIDSHKTLQQEAMSVGIL